MPSRGRKRKSDLSAIVLFPNKREIACASLGLLKVFEVMRQRVAVADISFLPSGEDDHILSPRQNLLLGEMSHLEVSRFDIIGFSVSYENDYVHVPELLIRAGLLCRFQGLNRPEIMGGQDDEIWQLVFQATDLGKGRADLFCVTGAGNLVAH